MDQFNADSIFAIFLFPMFVRDLTTLKHRHVRCVQRKFTPELKSIRHRLTTILPVTSCVTLWFPLLLMFWLLSLCVARHRVNSSTTFGWLATIRCWVLMA